MIDVTNVSKSYGLIHALRDVSFHVDAGEIIGLLGPNGAGKTTMMKILTGYLQPDVGQVQIDGLDVLTDTLEVQKRIGYLPENAPLYPEMSVQAYLKMIAELRQIPEEDEISDDAESAEQDAAATKPDAASGEPPLTVRRALSAAIRATALEDHLTRPISQLSKGYRQRVGLAQAILHQPKLLILDEPTVGLDPTQIVEVRGLIRRLARHSTILLCTHILSEVEATCSRVIVLLNGQIKADARLADLSATSQVVMILDPTPGGDTSTVSRALRSIGGVRDVRTSREEGEDVYRIRGNDGVDLRPAIYALARDGGWPLRELRRDTRTLETVFNELVAAEAGRSSAPAAAADEGEKAA